MTQVRKPKSPQPDFVKSSAASVGSRLVSSWWVAYTGAAAVIIAVLLALVIIVSTQEERIVMRHLGAFAGILADQLADRTIIIRDQLQRWRDDHEIRAVLRTDSDNALRALETELAQRVPNVLGVKLLGVRQAGFGSEMDSSLSYAGLDMVRRVFESGETTALEAHRVNQTDEHLAIAGPVMDENGDRLLGVIHLMLPLSLLPTVGDLGTQMAHFQFRQRAGQRFVAIDNRHFEAQPSDAPATRLAVPGTSLLIEAWGEPRGMFATALLPWVGGLYAGALVLLALVTWFSGRRMRKRVEADLASIVALANDAANRRPLRVTRNQIAEFKPVQDVLRRILRDLADATKVRPSPSGDPAVLAAVAEPTASEEPEEIMELDIDDEEEIDFGSGRDAVLKRTDSIEVSEVEFEKASPVLVAVPPAPAEEAATNADSVTAEIFRGYDVRGLVGSQINAQVMRLLGMAVASEASQEGSSTCVIARDQRPSGGLFAEALAHGLRQAGCNVIDLGIAPVPVLYFAAHARGDCSAAMITASHNPGEYNGLKVVIAGQSATVEQNQALHQRILKSDFKCGDGTYAQGMVFDDYIAEVQSDIALARSMKVVIDCGYGTTSLVAASMLRALSCEVLEFDCDLDPERADAHMPDPSKPANLSALGEVVLGAEADIGLAFDADGDRLGVVDSNGRFISIDRVLMLLAADVLARLPGSAIVYDVKCSHHLQREIVRCGGRPVMSRSGHSHLKATMRNLDAPLGGELSGHILFRERWNGFDDALYAGARLLELLALDPRSSAEVFADLPAALGTPELYVPLALNEAQEAMEAVLGMANRLEGVEVNLIDGLRAEFGHGWGLVRASNTQPGLVFRFEADDQQSLDRIEDLFRRMMELVAPELELPF